MKLHLYPAIALEIDSLASTVYPRITTTNNYILARKWTEKEAQRAQTSLCSSCVICYSFMTNNPPLQADCKFLGRVLFSRTSKKDALITLDWLSVVCNQFLNGVRDGRNCDLLPAMSYIHDPCRSQGSQILRAYNWNANDKVCLLLGQAGQVSSKKRCVVGLCFPPEDVW